MRPERANRQRQRQRQREAEEELERGRRTGWEPDHEGIVFPVGSETVGIKYKA